jgi:hypothetical protein
MQLPSAATTTTIVLMVFLCVWIATVFTIGPDQLVTFIGPRNGYLVAFLISLMGGFTLFTAVGLTATLASLAAGGLHPVALGIVAGIGITIADMTYYALTLRATRAFPDTRVVRSARKLAHWLEKQPWWILPFIIFVYIGLTPLPNELLAIALALTSVGYRSIVPSLLLGNITLATALALIGVVDMRQYFW